jgi:baseplate J-like protein
MSQPLPAEYQVLQIPTSIDYTSKDFTGFTTSMLTYAKQIMPDWNPTSEGDFGLVLLELFAYAADILSYYGDRISQEAYLPTATQRTSLLNIAQLLGYIPSNGTPSSGTVTIQTTNPGVATVVPELTQVSTTFNSSLDQPIIFETQESVTIAANGATQTIPVTQGITYQMVLLGTSDGTAGQMFTLPQQNVIDGSTTIYLQSTLATVEWTQVQYLVDSLPSDEVYTTMVDAYFNTDIMFGDNINGLVPALGLSVYATYRVGLGAAGNVGAGSVGIIVNAIPGVYIPTLSDNITYQSSAMSGGSDPETNDQIRANAPTAFATQYRAVSTADFASLAINVPGVIAANAVANHSTSVSLYIMGPGGQVPSAALEAATLAYFQGKTLAGVSLSVLSPNFILTDVGSVTNTVTISVMPRYSQAVVGPNVQMAVTALLTPPNTTFSQLLTVSDVYAAILAVAGVAWCTIPVITREDVVQTGVTSIQFRQSEVPVPGQFYYTLSGGF